MLQLPEAIGWLVPVGIDCESGGFLAVTWAADIGDGLEVDGYLGYGREFATNGC